MTQANDPAAPASKLFGEAMSHQLAGRLADAERDYLAVLALGYRHLDVMRLLAGLAAEDGRLEDALSRWQEVLRLAPGDPPALRARGVIFHHLGRWNEAVDALAESAALAPDDPSLATILGVALQDAGRFDEALAVLGKAAAQWPDDPMLRHQRRQAVQAVVPFWHVPMMNDTPRNAAFDRAIRRAVAAIGPSATVLDIGTGSGILSMMAARAGAASVVSCEVVPGIAAVARTIVERNGYADRVRIVAKKSTALAVGTDLDEPADLLVSEILSSSILSEHVFTSFEHAMSQLVKPSARIIPRKVTAVGCLAGGPVLERMAFVDVVDGFDLSPFTSLAAPRLPVNGFAPPWLRLSDDLDLLHIDLTQKSHMPVLKTLAIPVRANGIAVGVMQWIRVELDEETEFENPPDSYEFGGWQQVLHTFSEPIPVTEGQTFMLIAGHDRSSLVFTADKRSPAK
jgi:type II protein arginine methyltransferase